jgi:Arc/MetJ family transcription regulator
MKTTLNISEELLEEAIRLTGSRTKTEAIHKALTELIRKQKVEKIIGLAGKLDFNDDWEKARHER